MPDVLLVGGGIGGLTLALELSRRGIGCRVFESAPEIKAVGVGVNLLPHAMRAYAELGLQPALERVAVETKEAAFFNRFGQLIYREPLGRRAGYEWPQRVRERAGNQGRRGRREPAAARDARVRGARSAACARTRGGRDQGSRVLQPLRPAHLSRAARAARRLRVAAACSRARRKSRPSGSA